MAADLNTLGIRPCAYLQILGRVSAGIRVPDDREDEQN
jgi:hypothetical protein